MFKISFDESLKNFDKNRFITILSVFLFALLFVLEGYTMSYHAINEYRKTRGNYETFQNTKKGQMCNEFACLTFNNIQFKV